MTAPISQLPPPPALSDSPTDFNVKAFALLGALPAFVTEANTQASGIDAAVAAAALEAYAAALKAGESLTSANNAALAKTGADSARDAAGLSAASALDSKNAAQTARTGAEAAAAAARGGIKAYDTRAEAAIASALLPDGADIEVAQDETKAGARTRYKVQSGGLAFQGLESEADSTSYTPDGVGAALTTVKKKLDGIVTPKDFGAVGDGIHDDVDAFVKLAAKYITTQVEVDLLGATYYIGAANQIPLHDTISYRNGAFLVDSSTIIVDTAGDTFGRFSNGIFWRSSSAPFLRNFHFEDVKFKINRSKVNGIGGVSCANTAGNTGMMFLIRAVYEGYAPGNNVPIAAIPGQAATESGGLVQIVGYSVTIDSPKIEDAGAAIYLPNSDIVIVRNAPFIAFSGVSRDFTKWHNVSAVIHGGSRYSVVNNNNIHITGGTSIFGSGINTQKKVELVNKNVITGAGLSAIGSGVRSFASGQSTVELIDHSDNTVRGFLCAPGSDAHGGIGCTLEDSFGSTLAEYIANRCLIDYLAPWESWNSTDGDVSGSYNLLKKKGSDCGNLAGVSCIATTTKRIERFSAKDVTVRHCQRIGLRAINVKNVAIQALLERNGWSKTAANAAQQIQQSLYIGSVDEADVAAVVSEQSPRVLPSNAFCSPVFWGNVESGVLNLRIKGVTNQTVAIRLVNGVLATGRVLKIRELDLGSIVSDAGHRSNFDLSGSADNNVAQEIEWLSYRAPSLIAGYRTMSPGAGDVISGIGFGGTETLPYAKHSKGVKMTINVKTGAGTMSVALQGTDTIDGSNAIRTISPGNSLALFSNGVEWKNLA